MLSKATLVIAMALALGTTSALAATKKPIKVNHQPALSSAAVTGSYASVPAMQGESWLLDRAKGNINGE